MVRPAMCLEPLKNSKVSLFDVASGVRSHGLRHFDGAVCLLFPHKNRVSRVNPCVSCLGSGPINPLETIRVA